MKIQHKRLCLNYLQQLEPDSLQRTVCGGLEKIHNQKQNDTAVAGYTFCKRRMAAADFKSLTTVSCYLPF